MNQETQPQIEDKPRLPLQTNLKAGYSLGELWQDVKTTGAKVGESLSTAAKSAGETISTITSY